MADKNKKAKRRDNRPAARPRTDRTAAQAAPAQPMSNLEKTMAARRAAEKFKNASAGQPSRQPARQPQQAPQNARQAQQRGRQQQNAGRQRTAQQNVQQQRVPQRQRPVSAPGAAQTRPGKNNAAANNVPPKKQQPKTAKNGAKKNTRAAQPKRPLSTQTPKQRKVQQQRKKITGSAKNLEVNRHVKTKKTSYRIKKQKKTWRVLLSRFITFMLFFALISGIIGGIFFFKLTRLDGSGVEDYTIQIGDNNASDMISLKSSSANVYRNGAFYIAIDALRDYCEFTVTGDTDEIRYIPRGTTGQQISFTVGSNTVVVNGSPVRMQTPSFVSGGNLYIPVSFFERYVKNLSVMHAPTESKITVVRAETAESVADTSKDKLPVYEPILFTLGVDEPLTHITEQSVDDDD